MRLGSTLMFGAAVVIALLAGLLAQTWLEQQRRLGQPAITQPEIRTGKIVVATQPLRFGAELTGASLREIDWPAGAVPAGAFSSIAELLKAGEHRVVLSAIEVNEPILRWKITGPGQRASLSSLINLDMKAVTIRVNDVFGVAGFVLPGDRVDVLLTRTDLAQGDEKKNMYTDVLIQHVRVLGVDQIADDRTDKPTVAKAVTLEVSTQDAQRVALAGTLGSLSLVLRPAGAADSTATERITADTLDGAVSRGSHKPSAGELESACARVFVTRVGVGLNRSATKEITKSGSDGDANTLASSNTNVRRSTFSRTGYPVAVDGAPFDAKCNWGRVERLE